MAAKEFGKLYYQEVEQLSTRRRAVDINMRDFHNWVKARLVNQIQDINNNGRKMLLDLSVGKGGDMKKWLRAGVSVVVGIDISGTAIEEARRRYREQLTSDERRRMDAYFIHGDSTRLLDLDGNMCLDNTSKQEWRKFQARYGIDRNGSVSELQVFDMVVSNFAIHYIIETPEQREILCNNLARCLLPGGAFVGTLLDADIVRAEMHKTKNDLLEAKTNEGDVFYRIENAGKIGTPVKKIVVSRTGWANPIPEPAIGANRFVKILRDCSGGNDYNSIQWSDIELDSFENLYKKRKHGKPLGRGERYISFMHKIFIAKRVNI